MKNYITIITSIISLTCYGQSYESYKTLSDTTITSKYLGFEKNITIRVPYEWQKDLNREFPLIIVFDRQNPRSHAYIINTIDYLTSNYQMPESIIISVESEQKYRYLETMHKASSAKGLASENEKFIFDELIPLAEDLYKASPFRLFIGHSRYGYFTTSLLSSRIDELNGVISLSPFFSQKNVDLTDSIKNLKDQVFNSTKYYRFGIGNDYPSDFYKMDSVLSSINNTKFNTNGYLFNEAEHNVTPGLTIGIALYEIFEKWSEIQSRYISNDQKDIKIKETLDLEMNRHYGINLEFSLGMLNGKGWYFYNEKEYEKAIEAWQLLVELFPNFSETYLYIMNAKIKLNQDIAATEKQFLKSIKTTEMYTEEEKKELIDELETFEK